MSDMSGEVQEGIIGELELESGLLSNQAARHIRALIIAGDLRKGDRLPSERRLSEQLGVSRTALREATKLLKEEGWLVARVGVGTFVTEPSHNILKRPLSETPEPYHEKLKDLHQARRVIEPTIAALAARHATDEHLEEMYQAIAEMDQNLGNSSQFIIADNKFHMVLAQASQNSVFQLMLNSIVELLQEARKVTISVPGTAEMATQYHHRIFEAVRSGDPAEAKRAMEEHLASVDADFGLSEGWLE